jgi:hypothetical protein
MNTTHKHLLIIDAGINLILGCLLLLFPTGIAARLGVPQVESAFYPVILGAVLFGIGLALMLEAFGGPRGIRGLGIAGAIVINFCGAGMLAIYLLAGTLEIPLRGQIILWSIAMLVLTTGVIELLAGSWRA